MAVASDGLVLPFKAGADQSSNATKIVKIGAADQTVILAAGSTVAIIGVLQEASVGGSGSTVGVQVSGIGRVTLGGTVTRGDTVTSDAAGLAVTQATPAAATDPYILGIALASGAVNEVIPVLLMPGRWIGG